MPDVSDIPAQSAIVATEFGDRLRTQRITAVLRALCECIYPQELLVVGFDASGFPVAQLRLERPIDLPAAVVIGRHPRSRLCLPEDGRLALRHVLLAIHPQRGPVRCEGLDLGGGGIRVPNSDRLVLSFVSRGSASLRVGASQVMILDGEDAPFLARNLCAEMLASYFADPLRVDFETSSGRATLQRQEPPRIDGYRAMAPAHPTHSPCGILRLRLQAKGRLRPAHRDLFVDSEQLRQGLLIGRYSEQCLLASDGRNLSRIHALVCEEGPDSLLVYDLASTNGLRPFGAPDGPSHRVLRLSATTPCLLGQFELHWLPRPSAR